MTLIKFGEFLQPQNSADREYIGKVVFNKDPEKLQRVKVIIPGILENEEIEHLPFVTPKNGIHPFGDVLSVPDIDSEILVTFLNNDKYLPMYENYIDVKSRALALDNAPVFNVDYPYTQGFQDAKGTYIAKNIIEGYIELQHKGIKINMDKDGKVKIFIPDKLEVEIIKETTIHGKKTIKINSDDHIELNGNSLPSARKTDLTKHICPVLGCEVPGWIDGGDSSVKHKI